MNVTGRCYGKKRDSYEKVEWCYLCYDYSFDDSMGVVKKIKMQINAISSIAGGCDAIFISKRKIELYIGSDKEVFTISSNELHEKIKDYNFFYHRYGGAIRLYNNLLKLIKSLKKTNIVEIPTYPIMTELFGIAKGRFNRKKYFAAVRSFLGGIYLEKILFKFQSSYVDYYVLSSIGCKIKGMKTINISNGIDINKVKVRNYIKKDNFFNMLVVANVSVWHGIDRVIEGIKAFASKENVRLYVVGDGEALSDLKLIVSQDGIEKQVFFEGRKFGDDLDYYFNFCDIAIGSLGLHRLNSRPSTLKSKEYMARGIPFVISSTEDGNLDEKVKKYIFFVEEGEEPLDIEKVIDWYKTLKREDASEKLRNYACENYSWNKQMEIIINEVSN